MYNQIVSFIKTLYAGTEGTIPLHAPCLAGNEKRYLEACIDSTFVSSVGKFVDRFEEMVADYTGAARAVVCVNGTNALHMALLLAGVKQYDEVITQPLTFIATANAISYIGARPVFLDVDRDTLGLSPAAVEQWLKENAQMRGDGCYNRTTGNRIAACVPMHTFGHPVHLDELLEVCNRYHIAVVEDAAESLGSFYKGKHTGTFGKIGVLSFNGNKTVTTGGGGMLLFQDADLGARAKHLTTQAKLPHRWEFVHDAIGYNYRMPNINAALGCAQMENLPLFIEKKREIAHRYNAFFEALPVSFFTEPEGCQSNYWLNTLIMPDKESRDEFLAYSNDNGVMTRPAWRLMTQLPMFEQCQHDHLTNAHWLEERIINIPSSVVL